MARWRAAIGADHRDTAEAAPRFVPGFTPGKAGPLSDDPRHNRVYPHPENPGLMVEPDGFYDWANRRLYLEDGSPDPMTPGAYRYQTRPDLCDLDAPNSDPANPRYEPDHLRSKPDHLRNNPGDTWLIDRSRPYDVLDPGPFGSPGWFPDRRTGRHRRDELPDPIPWWEAEEEPEKAEWAEQAEALWLRRTRITRERESRQSSESGTSGPPDRPGPPGGSGTTSPGYPDEPDEPQGSQGSQEPDEPRTRFDQPRWRSQPGRADSISAPDRDSRRAGSTAPETPPPVDPEAPHYFGKLREDAWDRFIEKTEVFAAAHQGPVQGGAVRAVRADRTVQADHTDRAPSKHRRHQSRRWWGDLARGVVAVVGRAAPKPSRQTTAPAAVPVQRRRPAVAPDRHTHLALRTARFAGAVRGAQRARTEADPAPRPAGPPMPNVQVHWQTRPRQQRPSPGPTAAFISNWERRFDQSTGGAAWA